MALRSFVCILALSGISVIEGAAIDASYVLSRSTQAPAGTNPQHMAKAAQDMAKDAQEMKLACQDQAVHAKVMSMGCRKEGSKTGMKNSKGGTAVKDMKNSKKMKGEDDKKGTMEMKGKDTKGKDTKDNDMKGNDMKGNDMKGNDMKGNDMKGNGNINANGNTNGNNTDMGANNATQGVAGGQNEGFGGQSGKADEKGMGMGQTGGANTDMAALKQPEAIYFMTNANDNAIIALPVMENGNVMDGSITPTGGKGQSSVDPMTNKSNAVDGTVSQGAVRVAGQNVFAVNPGSNTVSMFEADAKDPTKLTMVGQPADTLGEFPNTMAVSTKQQMVCVANSGAKAGVACAKMDAKTGIGKMDMLRPFDMKQKTPPTGPLNTVSHTLFNEQEDALLTMVKGDPTANSTGFMSAFKMENGAVSMQETRSSPNGTAVLFGTAVVPGTQDLMATDASFGAAILSVDKDLKASIKSMTKIGGQKATCWATVSAKTGTGFVTDVGVNSLVEMDPATGAMVQQMNLTTPNPGNIDLQAQGNFMYMLSPGNATENKPAAVAVFDLSGGKGQAKQIQNFNPKNVADTVQGMAVMV